MFPLCFLSVLIWFEFVLFFMFLMLFMRLIAFQEITQLKEDTWVWSLSFGVCWCLLLFRYLFCRVWSIDTWIVLKITIRNNKYEISCDWFIVWGRTMFLVFFIIFWTITLVWSIKILFGESFAFPWSERNKNWMGTQKKKKKLVRKWNIINHTAAWGKRERERERWGQEWSGFTTF